ncbi:MAG TPA: tRNA 2-thiouridine(34) synthase MnmA [Candidatus Rifleibacterium sp.]|nr:tRNA 2-thiouridine(34) synthase MnmA [Candidatus Rifleibacterium sp.]HPT44899.1 tRNA 2-thiouridine(34) synthase MnmA [Candidatus Rifleibacterium sp.]
MSENHKTLIAAMSGGVDSSVATALFLEKGYKVIGVTLKMKTCDDSREKTKSCCGLDDNIQVRLVAEKLGIPHRFIAVREEFSEQILRYAWNEYKAGRTPNPCILCNHYLKFGAVLSRFAAELNADGIITGHYAIIDRSIPGRARLFKGANSEKDQTYFLSALTQEQLNHSYMPLGDLAKTDVRAMAARIGLPNAAKKESQDACFGYKDETFAMTLSRYFNDKPRPGDLVDTDGQVIGKHAGIQFFTIGQRKGLGVALGRPAYVTDIDPVSNRVTVSTESDRLLTAKFTASGMNWLDFDHDSLECEVQTRYRQPLQTAIVKRQGELAVVELVKPLASVTPGQRLAIFKNGQLLGGGWIEKS